MKKEKTINEVKREKGEDYKKDFPRLAKYKMVNEDDEGADAQRS